MNVFIRNTIASLIVLLLAGTPRLEAQNLDVDILKGINPTNPSSQYWIQTSNSMHWTSGAIAIGTLAYGLIAKDKLSQHNAYELFLSLAISGAVMEAGKIAVNRERPAEKYPGIIFAHSNSHGKSFPSGHTSIAFATATTLALEYHKWYIAVPAFLWAGSVGYSRLYLGAHYPSDVLGGAVVGIGSGYLGHWLRKKIFKEK